MKKFLLTMAAVVCLGFGAQAADVTITANQAAGSTKITTGSEVVDGKSFDVDGYTFSYAKNNGATTPAYYVNRTDLRLYAKNTMTISGGTMTKMVFTLSNIKRACDVEVNTGTMNYDVAGKIYTWTGNATSVTFTVPEKSNENAEEPNNTAQFCWSQVVISGDGVVTPKAEAPVFTPASGTIVPAEGLSVTITAGEGATIYYTTDGSNPTTDSDEYVSPIAITSGCTIKAFAVEEGKDASNIVTAVYKNPAVTVADIAAFIAKADAENQVTIAGPVTVTGEFTTKSGQYLYIQDASGYLLVYDKNKKIPAYGAGDQISNITGVYSIYNYGHQMTPDVTTFGTATAGTVPAPTKKTVAEVTKDIVNMYVMLEDVTITSEQSGNYTNYYAVSGSDKIQLYTQFGSSMMPENLDGTFDVVGYVSNYNDKPQVYPVSVAKHGETPVVYEVATIAEFLEKAAGGTDVWTITGDVKTVYQNGSNLYIQDVEAPYTGILVYGTLNHTYAPGTILSGIKGSYENYYCTIELKAQASSFGEGTPGDAPVITKVGLENITSDIQNLYVELEGVTVSDYNADNKSFTITDGKDDTIGGHNKFGVNVPADSKTYTIKGVVSYYQAKDEDPKVQIYPIEFVDATGIDAIGVDINAADAEYYNLQGIRVAEPEQGIYIVRQGGKTAKVIVRK